jgi:hypothetical protein
VLDFEPALWRRLLGLGRLLFVLWLVRVDEQVLRRLPCGLLPCPARRSSRRAAPGWCAGRWGGGLCLASPAHEAALAARGLVHHVRWPSEGWRPRRC